MGIFARQSSVNSAIAWSHRALSLVHRLEGPSDKPSPRWEILTHVAGGAWAPAQANAALNGVLFAEGGNHQLPRTVIPLRAGLPLHRATGSAQWDSPSGGIESIVFPFAFTSSRACCDHGHDQDRAAFSLNPHQFDDQLAHRNQVGLDTPVAVRHNAATSCSSARRSRPSRLFSASAASKHAKESRNSTNLSHCRSCAAIAAQIRRPGQALSPWQCGLARAEAHLVVDRGRSVMIAPLLCNGRRPAERPPAAHCALPRRPGLAACQAAVSRCHLHRAETRSDVALVGTGSFRWKNACCSASVNVVILLVLGCVNHQQEPAHPIFFDLNATILYRSSRETRGPLSVELWPRTIWFR